MSALKLYGGQFMLSTQLKILKYPVILSLQHSTTVSLESYPLSSIDSQQSLPNFQIPLSKTTVISSLLATSPT